MNCLYCKSGSVEIVVCGKPMCSFKCLVSHIVRTDDEHITQAVKSSILDNTDIINLTLPNAVY